MCLLCVTHLRVPFVLASPYRYSPSFDLRAESAIEAWIPPASTLAVFPFLPAVPNSRLLVRNTPHAIAHGVAWHLTANPALFAVRLRLPGAGAGVRGNRGQSCTQFWELPQVLSLAGWAAGCVEMRTPAGTSGMGGWPGGACVCLELFALFSFPDC